MVVQLRTRLKPVKQEEEEHDAVVDAVTEVIDRDHSNHDASTPSSPIRDTDGDDDDDFTKRQQQQHHFQPPSNNHAASSRRQSRTLSPSGQRRNSSRSPRPADTKLGDDADQAQQRGMHSTRPRSDAAPSSGTTRPSSPSNSYQVRFCLFVCVLSVDLVFLAMESDNVDDMSWP